jgi:hypothetical protein
VATLNTHSATPTAQPPAHGTSPADDETSELDAVARPTRSTRRHRRPAPTSRVAYVVGTAAVCTLALVNLLSGSPAPLAAAEPQEQSASASVADALGIEGSGTEDTTTEDHEMLGQLAASRADREAEETAAAQSQAQAEQAAAAARAEAEAKAAAEAAAAAAAAEEAAKAAEAATAAGSTAITAVAKIINTAGPLKAVAQHAADAVVSNVPGAGGITLGGTRASATDPHGHPSGLAIDYMVMGNTALGDAIVEYHRAHWAELGVEYLIYQQRYLGSPDGAWKPMENRGSPTANHMDHVHVNYVG